MEFPIPSEETRLVPKGEPKQELHGFCRRLLILTALLLFLCALLRGVSELARLAEGNAYPVPLISKFSWGCPPEDFRPSFHDQLWCDNLDQVNAAYKTDFIQGILDGSLDHLVFENFQIQDAYWETKVARIYKNACKNTDCTEQLRDLFVHVSDSYSEAANEKLTTYKAEISDIIPTEETRNFVKYLRSIARTHPTQYNAISILSDLKLWVELAKRLKNKGAADVGQPFRDWILDVIQCEVELNEASKFIGTTHDYDFDLSIATEIYNSTLEHNLDFFKKATA